MWVEKAKSPRWECAPAILQQHLTPRVAHGHVVSCDTTFKARYALHSDTQIERVVGAFAAEAGGTIEYEPATSGLLLNKLNPSQCRTLFPRYSSRSAVARAAQLAQVWNQWALSPPRDQSGCTSCTGSCTSCIDASQLEGAQN